MGAEQEEEMINGNLPPNRHLNNTPITPAQFLAWKRRKDEDAASKRAEEARKREEDIRAGRVQMNGRELFIHEPAIEDSRSKTSSQTDKYEQPRQDKGGTDRWSAGMKLPVGHGSCIVRTKHDL